MQLWQWHRRWLKGMKKILWYIVISRLRIVIRFEGVGTVIGDEVTWHLKKDFLIRFLNVTVARGKNSMIQKVVGRGKMGCFRDVAIDVIDELIFVEGDHVGGY